jgi:transposase
LYPDIQKTYDLAQDLRNIFEKQPNKIGLGRLARWHEKVNQSGFKSFNTISRSIMNHYQTILNYFDNRSTNASAESFNAKIKAFRSQFRGVRNVDSFRLTIYA